MHMHTGEYSVPCNKVFYWPGWRKGTSLFVTECAGCLHREEVKSIHVEPFQDHAKNINDGF